MEPKKPFSLIARTEEIIDQFGWMGIGVFPVKDYPLEHPFTYTVGRWRLGRPELVVSGILHETAQTILHGYIDRFIDEEPEVGVPIPDLLQNGYEPATIELPWEVISVNFGVALSYYDGELFPARQIILPDQSYRLPTEPGCDLSMIQRQVLEGPGYQICVPDEGGPVT